MARISGDVITSDTGFMRGHGTVMEDDSLKSTVAGVVERVNKLVSVRPLKARYTGEIGDVIVGRVIEVINYKTVTDQYHSFPILFLDECTA